MTPLGGGPRGYLDWQRVVSWDGPILVNETTGEITGNKVYPVAETSRFGYVAGLLRVTKVPVRVTFRWYLDSAATVFVGARTTVIDPEIGEGAIVRVPNLGPWLQISVEPRIPAETWGPELRLFLTNRTHPLELVPRYPALFSETHVFAAAESLFRFPATYYAGPLRCFISTGVSAASVQIEAETAPGTFVPIDKQLNGANETQASALLAAPTGAWRMQLASGGGATHSFALAPFPTGSS